MSGNKDSNTVNASWLEEQDWTLFGKKDLPVIETKILKLEAEIASELKECNIIKSISEWMSSNMDESVVSPNKKSVPSSGMFLYLIHGNMII